MRLVFLMTSVVCLFSVAVFSGAFPGGPGSDVLTRTVGGLAPVPGEDEECKKDTSPVRTCKSEWQSAIHCYQNWCAATNQTQNGVHCPQPTLDCTNTDELKSCQPGTGDCSGSNVYCGIIDRGECAYTCLLQPQVCSVLLPWNCAGGPCCAVAGTDLACPQQKSCTGS